ncbi:histone-lysine N-methyltransferase SETMAR-like [Saccostrea echinata]|uniref:histone-lysine N-methyltransferase SETMAR-like n=1 Tax=Saccostrea echinata TaxID=191078 RepID=UPI002A7EE9D1|nr:histone-lysine N-methyltransferase SETMAR-like [Saccostrea echinata]
MLDQADIKPSVCRTLVFKWHKRFSDGWTSVEDDPGRGRKTIIEENLILRVKNVIESDRRHTVQEISAVVGISTGTVHTILTEHLNMCRVSARWIPRLLSVNDKAKRVRLSRNFLRRHASEGDSFINKIITTDETWLFYFDPETKQQSSAWKRKSSPPPQKAKLRQSSRKNMFIFFMDIQGMLLIHAVPAHQTVNADYYSKVIRRDLLHAVRKKRPGTNLAEMILHQDNAPAHRAETTILELDLLGLERVEHAPYSPDLAPMDFKVFPTVKSQLRGRKFDNIDELKYATRSIVSKLDKKWYRDVYDEWIRRHKLCIKHKGEFFEKM